MRQGRLGTTVARLKPKGIGGSSNKRRNMLFNSTLRETPHQCLLTRAPSGRFGPPQVLHGCRQFVAQAVWLIPPTNETPKTPAKSPWDHFKSSWPQCTGRQVCYVSETSLHHKHKKLAGSDSGLQLDLLKKESLVIGEHVAPVNRSLSCAHTAHHVRKDTVG